MSLSSITTVSSKSQCINGGNLAIGSSIIKRDIEVSHQQASIAWFHEYYPIVTDASTCPEQYRLVEVLQNPGETVFVPAGWPHLVLNLELTVAVTHHYVSEFERGKVSLDDDNVSSTLSFLLLERIWKEFVLDEPEFGKRWWCGLVLNRKDLAERIKGYHERAVGRGDYNFGSDNDGAASSTTKSHISGFYTSK